MSSSPSEKATALAAADARVELLRRELRRKREKLANFRAMLARREEKLRKLGGSNAAP